MEAFTITELSYAVIAMSGAVSGVLLVVWKSRCRTINCCWGGARCDREVLKDEGTPPLSTRRLQNETVYQRPVISPNVDEATL